MTGADVIGTVLPLVGVALGAVGTLTGQYLATRSESRRHGDQRAAALRAERKEAIVAFLDAAQHVEQVLDARDRKRPVEPAESYDRLHAMWLAKKVLDLVGSNRLASAAHEYNSAPHALVRTPERPRERRLSSYRAEFMEAARQDLGIQEPPLYPVS